MPIPQFDMNQLNRLLAEQLESKGFYYLWNSLNDRLVVSARISGKTGPTIEVGERFKVTIEVTNQWNPPFPRVNLERITVTLNETPHARFFSGVNPTLLVFPYLSAGQTASKEVDMQAVTCLENMASTGNEPIVQVRVGFDVDYKSFFTGFSTTTVLNADIKP